MEFTPSITLYFFLCLFPLLYIILIIRKPTNNNNQGFQNLPILGTIPALIANRHRFLEWSTSILSTHPTQTAAFHRYIGGTHGVLTANPANVEHILKTNFINYPKGPRFINLLHDFLGTGIFNSDGPMWQLQRKTASFAFTMRTLRNFLMDTVQAEINTRLNPLLKEASELNRVLDLQDVLERFAFDNVCKLAFNVDPACLDRSGSGESEFMKAFDVSTAISTGRFLYAIPLTWKIKRFVNFGSEKKLRGAIKIVHEFADTIIRLRLEENKSEKCVNYEDLLSRFIVASEDDTKLLRDVVISVIVAGKDTTSTGLSWLFWLLSNNPDVVDKIRLEISRIRVRRGKRVGDAFDYEELKDMHYLHATISESLRLYPPVPVDTKACMKDDILPDGTRVQKGWFVMYHTYAMGRMESIWGKDCLEFKPERWLVDGFHEPSSPFKFPVFHAGPRVCLGKEMAYIQMKSIVANVVEQFDVDVIGKELCPSYLLSLTLRMKNGLPVRLKARNVYA